MNYKSFMMRGWSQTKLETEGHTSQRTTRHMFIVANSKEPNIPFLTPYLLFMPMFQPHCASFLRMPSLSSSSQKRNCLAQAPITAFSFMLKRTMDLGFCLCKIPFSTMFFLTLLLLLEKYGTIIIHCVDVR